MTNEKRIEKLETVLWNAIICFVDETFEQYDDTEEWYEMIFNELCCTPEELESLGIKITVDGGIYSVC